VADKFPILDVAKASLLMPLNSPVNIAKAVGLLLVGIVGLVLLIFVGFFIAGGDLGLLTSALEESPTAEEIGQSLGQMNGIGGGLFGMLLGFVLFLGISAHIFNYWVRYATFGQDGASFGSFGRSASAAAVNGFKFILIFILIGAVVLVINFVLASLGLTASITDQAQITDATDQYLAGFSLNIIAVIVTCFVYSMFSANLTQTAIGNDQEALEHPHAVDFSVVLMIVYSVVVIPMVVLALIGSDLLFMVAQYILGILVMLAIPAAHGLRYRFCTGAKAEAQA